MFGNQAEAIAHTEAGILFVLCGVNMWSVRKFYVNVINMYPYYVGLVKLS